MMTAEELVLELNNEEENKNFKLATVTALFENSTAKLMFDGEDVASEKQYAYLDSYAPNVNDRVLLGVLGGTYVILGKINYNVSPSTEEEVDKYLFDLKKVIMQKGLKITLGTETDTLTVNNGTTLVGNVGVNGTVTATGLSASGDISGANINTSGTLGAGAATLSSLVITGNEVTNGYHQVKSILYADAQFIHRGTSLSFFNAGSVSGRQNVGTHNETPTVDNLKTKLNTLINALKNYNLIN